MATTRTTAEQETTVTLKINFLKNGVLSDPFSLGTVTIIDFNSVIQKTGIATTKESTGVYSITYAIPVTGVVGVWTDRWTDVVFSSGLDEQDVNLSFHVYAKAGAGASPGICTVYEILAEQDGDLLENITGTAEIISLPYTDGSIYYSSTSVGSSTSNSNGRIEWDLVQGATVFISISEIKLERTIVVPTKAEEQLQNITEVTP